LQPGVDELGVVAVVEGVVGGLGLGLGVVRVVVDVVLGTGGRGLTGPDRQFVRRVGVFGLGWLGGSSAEGLLVESVWGADRYVGR
jgi:hypothetical protein